MTRWLAADSPAWLLALALAPLAAWLRLRPGAPPEAARASAACRAALIAAIALALAGLRVRLPSSEQSVLFLIDRSESLDPGRQARALRWVDSALRKAGPRDSAGIIAFGADAVVEASPQKGLALGRLESAVDRGGTDIAGALRLARAVLPLEGSRRVVLLSDGQETAGDMRAQALELAAQGVAVDVVSLLGDYPGDVAVGRLSSPPEAAPKEAVALSASVWTASPTAATARLFRDDRLVLSREVRLPAGDSSLGFSDRLEEPGLHTYRLFLDSPRDPRPQNNSGAAAVLVSGPPEALIVEGDPGKGAGLAAALAAAGIRARVVGRARMPRSLAEFGSFSAVLLSDVPAYATTPRAQAELRSYVGDLGGGLAMFGGPNSFGMGGYLHSPVEDALPVSMESKRPGTDLSLALAIVIDTSGSMAAMTMGVEKIQLAAEGAMRAVEMLGPTQSIGVCGVDTAPTWIVPLQPAVDKSAMVQKIGSLRAGGGGIYVYTGLQAAREALAGVKASVRHVILFSDAADAEEQVKDGRSALDLASEMAAEGITVSTVGLGTPADKDSAFLEESAKRGGGRFYLTDEIQNVPAIFMRETALVRRSAIVEEPFLPTLKSAAGPAAGIRWDSAPELKGYVIAEAKEAAEVDLATHRGDPLLAHWRYGLGKSVAFTSDATGRWSSEWARWPSAGKLWAQSARWILRPESTSRLSVSVSESGGAARITAEAGDPSGAPLNFLRMEGFWIAPDLSRTPLALSQTGPGRYEATAPARGAGTYLAHVRASGEGVSLSRSSSLIIPYSPEYAHGLDASGLAQLAEATGGRFDPPAEEAFQRRGIAQGRASALGPLLLLLAAMLLPVDVALRKIRWGSKAERPGAGKEEGVEPSAWGRAKAWLASRRARAPKGCERPASPETGPAQPQDQWGRLKEAKRRARK